MSLASKGGNQRSAATLRPEDWMLPNRDRGDKRSRDNRNPVSSEKMSFLKQWFLGL